MPGIFTEQNRGAILVLVCVAAAGEYKITHSYLHYTTLLKISNANFLLNFKYLENGLKVK